MSGEKLTVKEQVDFIFSKAIERRASFFVLVRSNKGLVVTYYQNKEGIVEVTNLEIPLESHSASFACMGYIRVNSGIDPVVPKGIEIIQRKTIFMVGQIEQKIFLTCIPSSVVGGEIMVINFV